MELKLICHGMMLFWYRKPSTDGGRDDGYTILIPQATVHNTEGCASETHMGGSEQHSPKQHQEQHFMHEVRLGVGAGARHSVLGYGSQPEGTKYFDLKFGCGISSTQRVKKSDECNLVIYRNQIHGAMPNYGRDPDAGVAFAIDIPYPVREESVRVTEYKNDPYIGTAVDAFCVHPRRVVATRVFTFEVADVSEGIVLRNKLVPCDTRVIQPGSISSNQKTVRLHLYSQPPKFPLLGDNHFPMLTRMLLVNGSPLDLCLNEDRCPDNDPDGLVIPYGLGFKDVLHLAELRFLFPHLCDPAGGHHHAKVGDENVITSFDPAECGQGGGC
jgi:hypothetical protein